MYVSFGLKINIFGNEFAWEGFYKSKLIRFQNVLTNLKNKISENCIIMENDLDVIYQLGEKEILEKYLTFNQQGILFSADCGCWRLRSFKNEIDSWCKKNENKVSLIPTCQKWVNAGAKIGRVKDYLKVLNDATDFNYLGKILTPKRMKYLDDQEIFQEMYYHNHTLVRQIDYYSDIFQSVQYRENCNAHLKLSYNATLKKTINKWKETDDSNNTTHNFPAVLHFTSGEVKEKETYDEYIIDVLKSIQTTIPNNSFLVNFIAESGRVKQVPLSNICP